MPSHHPVSAGVSRPLLKPRRERERLVGEVCDRLSEGLDAAVASLRELTKDRDARLRPRWRGPAGTSPRRAEA